MEKYLIKTTYPCLVKTQNALTELDCNDNLEVEDETFLFVYPADNSQIPFYINLSSPQESERLSIIKKDDKTLLLLEDSSKLEVKHMESLNFSGTICNISISSHALSFEANGKNVIYKCQHPCKNFKVFKEKNFACVQFEHDLYAFSTKNNKLVHFGGDHITCKKDTVTVQKRFHDSDNREKVSKYKFEDDIVLEEEHFSCDSHKPLGQLVPFKLLEGVKAKDFEGSLNFLSDNLQKQIGSAQLQEFFGHITSFLPITPTEFITITPTTKSYATFVLKDDKIDDILIDEL